MRLFRDRRRPHGVALAAVLLCLGLVTAACGSGGSGGSGGETMAEKLDGKIIGIGPGAGLTDASKKAINKVYNLEEYRLATSSTPSMLASLKEAIEEKKPIVVTLWRPHWAYAAFPIKDLKDPKGALGKGESIYAVAPTGWKNEHPRVAKWVSNFKLTPDQLFPLENAVVNKAKSKKAKRAAVDEWASKHQDLIKSWVGSSSGPAGSDNKIKIPYITWAEDIAVSYLWEHILEKRGFEVTLTQVGSAGPVFNAIASGDADLFFDYWLPKTHAQYKKKYGDQMVQLAEWFPDGATLEWAVPKYMEIDSITDLKS